MTEPPRGAGAPPPARSFSNGLTGARAAFLAGHPAAGLATLLSTVLLVIPMTGLGYLLARIVTRGAAAAIRGSDRLLSRVPAPAFTQRLWPGADLSRPGGKKASWRPRLTIALKALATVAVVAVAALATAVAWRSGTPTPDTTTPAGIANRAQAAAWVAQQVSRDVTVSCDPRMCAQVRREGFPAARLMDLGPAASNPRGSGVVVATPSLRSQFGDQLASVYAPMVIAGFGSGADRVDVRAIAPDGPAAFWTQLAAQHASLASAGAQLLRNKNIRASPAARAALLAGRVDSRLMATLSVLAAQTPVRLAALDAAPPDASPAVFLRGAQIGGASPASRSAILAFLHAQRSPYRPVVATASGTGAGSLVTVRFDVPGLTGP